MTSKDRHVGRFFIAREFIDEEPTLVRAALKDMIVLEAKSLVRNTIEYIAIHESFEEIPFGDDTPVYRSVVVKSDDGPATFQRWEKA